MMMKFASLMKSNLVAAAVAAALMFAGSQVLAQTEGKSGEVWPVICSDSNNAQSCRMEQKRYMNQVVEGKKKTLGKILNATILYVGTDTRQAILVMHLPLGVDLAAGIALKVDDYDEIQMPYLQCIQAGCEVRAALTVEFLTQLRQGSVMRVGFRPLGSPKTVVVDASLIGFSKAFKLLR